MLEKNQAAVYVLSRAGRELPLCFHTSHPSWADNCFLRDSQSCVLMCAQMHANPLLGSAAEASCGPALAVAFLLLAFSGDGAAP